MSESEKKKRLEYRQKRRKLILIQSVIAIIVAVMIATFFAIDFRVGKDNYLPYNQSSDIDYTVYLKENDFYEEDHLGKGQSYIAQLVDEITADFNYEFKIDANGLNCTGEYQIVGELVIEDTRTGNKVFGKEYPLKAASVFGINGAINVNDSITVNYDEYNGLAEEFLNVFDLADVRCNLILSMKVLVRYDGLNTRSAPQTDYSFALNVPLTTQKVDIVMTSVAPNSQSQVLAVDNGVNKDLFKILGICASVLEVIILAVLVIFVYKTRNDDINYEIKIKRLVAAYKSYIQKILSEFDFNGYQVLKVETFNEMLDIRDTVNSPILMSENVDKTCTKFLIPTEGGILYLHEIRVDDYDDIYGLDAPVDEEQIETEEQTEIVTEENVENQETTSEEVVTEETSSEEENACEEATDEQTLETEEESQTETQENSEEAKEEEISTVEEIVNDEANVEIAQKAVVSEEVQALFDGIKYDYSFAAKLSMAGSETREYYKTIMSFVKSYGLEVSRSWEKERIFLDKKTYAILTFKGFKLAVSYNLDPKEYEGTKYKLVDVSGVKKYSGASAQLKVTSDRKAGWAIELFEKMFSVDGVEDKKLTVDVEMTEEKTREQLIEEKLIKIEGK